VRLDPGRLLEELAMWPFKKKPKPEMVPVNQISFSQLDITERFGDHLALSADDWIGTVPINARDPNPAEMGLPPIGASDAEVYRVAEQMSRLREMLPTPNDGVYCPICHIANIALTRLGTPCPKCSRALLKFGWD
jgi:hypothetical protein